MTVKLHDKVTLKSSRKDELTGFLHADAVFSRVGIQEYLAFELGLQDRPADAIVPVYRPPEEVGATAAVQGLASIATTDDHPDEDVTSTNFRRLATGMTGSQVTFDGKFTTGTVILTDFAAIQKWEKGKKELSVGYSCALDWTTGTTPEGEKYEAIQRNIVPNHVAQVDAGRCGGACRIGDGQMCQDCASKQNASCNCHRDDDMSTGTAPTLVTRTVDGITFQVNDQGAQFIDKLVNDLAKEKGKVTELGEKVTELEAAHTAAIEAKDGEIAGLKTQIPDAAALDALATERAQLIAEVKKHLGDSYDPKGKSNLDLMKDTVAKALGEDAAKDKSEDFIRGVFTSLKPGTTNDSDNSIENVVNDGFSHKQQQKYKDGKPTGRDAYLARLKKGPDLAAAGR